MSQRPAATLLPFLMAAVLLGLCRPARAEPPHEPPARGSAARPRGNVGAPAIPDTPAGRTLRAWLDAFNSGERAQIEAYVKRYTPDKSADEVLHLRQMTGGFDLVGIDKSERQHVRFRVKERVGDRLALGTLVVRDADPATVTSIRLRVIPPGMTAADMDIKVDAATRSSVIDAIAAKLTEFYIYPDIAKKMIEALRAHQRRGAYDAISDGVELAALLSEHLLAVSHDEHLRVEAVPRALPKEDFPSDPPPPDANMRAELKRANCGFNKVELLPHNIGYLKFDFFGDPSVCGPVATAAMGFLANADAIIFDLRENHGGEPEMVAYVASYLFGARTHLNDLFERRRNKTTEYWTRPDLPGPKLVSTPAYVLTSRGTFSGGEEFTYDLKVLKRATIVGETTGGGAHPTGPHRAGDHFVIQVPCERPINPITKTDWEGTGVAPDVKVPADRALEAAQRLAVERVAKAPPPVTPSRPRSP